MVARGRNQQTRATICRAVRAQERVQSGLHALHSRCVIATLHTSSEQARQGLSRTAYPKALA